MPLFSLVSYLEPAPTMTRAVADSKDGIGTVRTRSLFGRIFSWTFIGLDDTRFNASEQPKSRIHGENAPTELAVSAKCGYVQGTGLVIEVIIRHVIHMLAWVKEDILTIIVRVLIQFNTGIIIDIPYLQ